MVPRVINVILNSQRNPLLPRIVSQSLCNRDELISVVPHPPCTALLDEFLQSVPYSTNSGQEFS